MSLASILRAMLGDRPLFTFKAAGAGELQVVRFFGREGISSLFEFRIELAGPELALASLVDKPALLKIEGIDTPRHVHGVIAEVEYVGQTREHTLYEATLVPWIWRLQHRQSCRIFQDETTPQILQKVLKEAGLAKDWLRLDLVADYAPRNYCVQYRETDLAFISRLMEEDGIFYFFEHMAERHVLVLADHAGAHRPVPGAPTVWFMPPGGEMVADREHVRQLRFGERVRPGKVSLRDFNLHQPDLAMEVKEAGKLHAELEVYSYPGEYQDPATGGPHQGQSLARLRLEGQQAARRWGSGASDCPRLTAGHQFTLVGHLRHELDGAYRLLHVSHAGSQPQVLGHDASGDSSYSNEFSVTEMKQPFRAPQQTSRPVMRGLQSATVVGPETEEVFPDEHGRVKVQFHWDRAEPFDETSSCWVRVSQLWAGNGWGSMFLPRIGHEVLVDFLEGDPDRPVVVGRIYTGNNKTPYPLPEQKTRSTIKSESSLGDGGYNELRFEDLKGQEQVFLHAERNIDVRVNNDEFSTVWRDSHVTVGHDEGGKGGDSFVQLFRDHHLKVHRNTQAQLGGDVQLQVGGIDGAGRVDVHVRSDKLELVEGDRHEHVVKSTLEKVDGSVSRVVGGNEHVKIAGMLAVQTGDEVHFKAPKIVLDASEGLTIKGPGGFVTINSGGVYIVGQMVYINSGGAPIAGTDAKPGTAQDAKSSAPVAATPSERGSK